MKQNSILQGKSVLITGGTGSFGRTLAHRLLTEDLCEKVIIFSRDEWKQWEMQQTDTLFKSPKVRFFLGDIRDPDRLLRAFDDVDYVIHAAALKQVPAAEYNPSEFVKTNIIGAMNIIDAAISCGVQKVIALSTDKSVNPVNLYGATKLCADKIFTAANSYVGTKGCPRFSVVRYGNVLESRGGVVSKWKELVENGAKTIPITHPDMTRFWITLDQSVSFVLSSLEEMVGEEIFVPKIPSMKIKDLAQAIAPGLEIELRGIRDGEKIHELLISHDESYHTFELDDRYIILPPIYKKNLEERRSQHPLCTQPVAEGFEYRSDTNSHWLDTPNT